MRYSPTHAALALLIALAACSKSPSETDSGTVDTDGVDTDVAFDEYACFSGDTWTSGNRGSAQMHPGRDCIGCHTAEREGPRFVIAGTVFTGLHEPDDCNGQRSVTVEITDDNGDVHTAKTNAAGNFFIDTRSTIALPYQARVFDDAGNESAMASHQTEGACNSCHTVDGANGAPGRIRLR
jgi:hypothetical protein